MTAPLAQDCDAVAAGLLKRVQAAINELRDDPEVPRQADDALVIYCGGNVADTVTFGDLCALARLAGLQLSRAA